MNSIKYIGMDVHVATTVITIMNSDGKVVTEELLNIAGSNVGLIIFGWGGARKGNSLQFDTARSYHIVILGGMLFYYRYGTLISEGK